jgi:hypothetical protein
MARRIHRRDLRRSTKADWDTPDMGAELEAMAPALADRLVLRAARLDALEFMIDVLLARLPS